MNTISIIIEGQPGVGKSAVAQIIEAALENAGIAVKLNDGRDIRRDPARLAAAVANIGKKSRVEITTKMLPVSK